MKSTCCNKHGAIIVQHNKIVARGHNYYVQNLAAAHTVHAEVAAIRKLRHSVARLHKHTLTLFVVRVVHDRLALSMPCSNCAEQINNCQQIHKTYYSA